jgi:hypothetical protein
LAGRFALTSHLHDISAGMQHSAGDVTKQSVKKCYLRRTSHGNFITLYLLLHNPFNEQHKEYVHASVPAQKGFDVPDLQIAQYSPQHAQGLPGKGSPEVYLGVSLSLPGLQQPLFSACSQAHRRYL